MKKNDWLIILSPLFIVWILDRITKYWASDITTTLSYGYLNFTLHHNHGAMLGLFSDLPSVLRIVTLSTGGAFLLCTYALIQYLLPVRSLPLRCGLSILLGGILGNVADRIMYGYIIDFIILGTGVTISPAFNIADAVQWVGYALIVYAIIREGNTLWPEANLRKVYWINRKFQLKYSFFLMGLALCLGVISIVFSYTYMRVTITDLMGYNPFILKKYLTPFIVSFILIGLTCGMIAFAIGKYISHRIAGPLFAFEKILEEIMNGQNGRILKLRAGDEFKHLEDLAEKVREKLSQNPEASEIRKQANDF